jgi:hypothetical protein
VLSSNVVVVEALRFLLRKLQDLPRPLGELVEAISHVIFHPVPETEPTTRSKQCLVSTQTIAISRIAFISIRDRGYPNV